MHRASLSFPELEIIAGTRAALGAGVGLLLADHLTDEQRRAVGWTLFAVGALSTVPILIQVLKAQSEASSNGRHDLRHPQQREYAS